MYGESAQTGASSVWLVRRVAAGVMLAMVLLATSHTKLVQSQGMCLISACTYIRAGRHLPSAAAAFATADSGLLPAVAPPGMSRGMFGAWNMPDDLRPTG
jgi:hypothetical protein